MTSARQQLLAERLRAWAWRNPADPIAEDAVAAAAIVEKATISAADDLRARNGLVRAYFARFLSDEPSQRRAIERFLREISLYRAGEFRAHQLLMAPPPELDDRRSALWMILTAGRDLPDTVEGIRLIVGAKSLR